MKKRVLISLKEHDDKKSAFYDKPIIYNGIECPLCGHELLDCDPNMILATYPARVATICSDSKNCDYRGSRIF